MFNISKENRVFGSAEFLLNASASILFSYIIVYLSLSGYTKSAIGVIVSSTYIFNIISQAATGYVSEYYISIKKILISFIIMTFLAVSLVPLVKQSYFAVFIIFAVISFAGRSQTAIIDNHVVKLSEKRSGLSFGFVRGFGSIGYAVTAVVAGIILDKLGYDSLFAIYGVACLLAFLSVIPTEDIPVQKKVVGQKTQSFPEAMKQLLAIKPYVITVVASTIVYIGATASSTYVPVIISDLGGDSSQVGIAIFLSAASEAPVLWNYKRISERFSIRMLLLLSFFLYVLRMGLLFAFPNRTIIIILQTMQSITFGLFVPAFISNIRSVVNDSLLSLAILLGGATYVAVGGVVGSLVGGVLLEVGGYYYLYTFCFLSCLAGAAIFGFSMLIKKIRHV